MFFVFFLISQSFNSTGTYITISNYVFSPYFSETTSISWQVNNATAPLDLEISIFNLKGARQKVLLRNPQATTAGSITFDGKDEFGFALPVGAYIVVFDAYDRNKNRFFDRRVLIIGRRL
ncbi:MAG: hypothetical protein NZ870_01785 [bacterium]|nr:hypothetical protein [bacterium]